MNPKYEIAKVLDRESGRDCISQMRLARSRPDVLANALIEMGVTPDGDGPEEDDESGN